MDRPAAKKLLAPVDRRAAQYVMPKVIAMKVTNMASAMLFVLLALAHVAELFENCFGLRIEAVGGTHVQPSQNPGHEELREREQVSDVYRAQNGDLHQWARQAHQHRQSEVINHEEQRDGHEETSLSRLQAFKFIHRVDSTPTGLIRLAP